MEWDVNKIRRKYFKKNLKISEGLTFLQLSECIYRVLGPGPIQSAHQVDLGTSKSCTCGGYETYKFPCEHMLLVLKHNDIDIAEFVCETWKKNTYVDANKNMGQMGNITAMQNLEKGNTLPPALNIRRGRHRVRRFPSQARDRAIRRRLRTNNCGICRETGHDRRNCPN